MSYERVSYKSQDADTALWKLPSDIRAFTAEKLSEIVYRLAEFINEPPNLFSVDQDMDCWYVTKLPINSSARRVCLTPGGYLVAIKRRDKEGNTLENRGDWGCLTAEDVKKLFPNIDHMQEVI